MTEAMGSCQNRESLLATALPVEIAAGFHMLESRFVEPDGFRLVWSRWNCLPMLLTVHPGTFLVWQRL